MRAKYMGITMTTPANDEPFSERPPAKGEQEAALQLRRIIAATAIIPDRAQELRVLTPGGDTKTIPLSPAMSGLLLDLLRQIADGERVMLVPMNRMLTTQQAADILNVSRPHLIKLIERSDIPCTMTGRHRRIRADELFAYKHQRDAQRAEALDDLAKLDGDML